MPTALNGDAQPRVVLRPSPLPARVILVDGTCVFCNGLVSFILKRDRKRDFHFAHLQGPFAVEALARHGLPPDIDRIYLVVDAATPRERLLIDGEAGREIWPRLFAFAIVLRWMPLPLLNLSYRLLSRYRYRLFGKYDSCHLPTPEERERLIA